MKFKLLLPFFIVFIVWLRYELGKSRRSHGKERQDYLEYERKANLTRRQNIDCLDYITIPLNSLPFLEINNEKIMSLQERIKLLAAKRIINLSKYSNTDLKFMYGAANLTALASYDENFTFLERALTDWACELINAGYGKEAVTVLEYGVSIECTTAKLYTTLANEYIKNGEPHKLEALIEAASNLNSLTKDSLVENLNSLFRSAVG